MPLNEILLPPAMTAVIPVTVQANGTGSFVLTGTAVGSTAQASDTASLTVATTGNGNDADLLYCPSSSVIRKQNRRRNNKTRLLIAAAGSLLCIGDLRRTYSLLWRF
ncbi:MAG: hypothetical protein R3E31_07765 [Chloroflexota bacterium]